MKELGEIRARLAAATPGPWLVNDEEQTVRVEHPEGGIWCGEIMFDRSGYGRTVWTRDDKPDAEFIANAPTDLARLLAAVEAVEALAEQWGSTGHIVALAFEDELRAAITAALTPTPAVPSGAGEARGAVDEYLGVDGKRGAQNGVQP